MNIFVQGMRRSGTTVLFDIMHEDSELDLYYEPFAAAIKPAFGGGSGLRPVDYFIKIRACREEFLRAYPEKIPLEWLNYGAPRDHTLELKSELSEFGRAYVRHMLRNSIAGNVAGALIKFTRLYCKVRELAAIDPNALFVHIVRDPRAMAASYLFGKSKRNAHKFPDEHTFFSRVSQYTAWSSYPLSEAILELPRYRHLKNNCEDFFRVMLLWAFTFRATHEAAQAAFGAKYMVLRNEDLRIDPAGCLQRLYSAINRPVPHNLLDWALKNVRSAEEPFAANHPAWREAALRLELEPDLAQAGYGFASNPTHAGHRAALHSLR